MKHLLIRTGSFLSFFLFGPAFSETLSHSKSFSLLDVYSYAEQNNPHLKAAEAAYQSSQHAKTIARSSFFPNIEASSISEHTLPLPASYIPWSVTLNQPLYAPGPWSLMGQADLGIKLAKISLTQTAQQLILRSAQHYFTILNAQEHLRLVQNQKLSVRKQLERAQQAFKVGLKAKSDVLNAQAAYDKTIADEVEAQASVLRAIQLQTELIHIHIDSLWPLKQTIEIQTPMPNSEEEWVKMAIHKNLALMASKLRLEQQKQKLGSAKSELLPKIAFIATLQDNHLLRKTKNKAPHKSFGLRASMPLFTGGRVSANISQQKKELEKATQEYDMHLRSTLTLTRQAYRDVLTQIARIKALEQAVASSENALASMKAAYKVGIGTMIEVLEAQSRLLSAQEAHTSAKHGYILSFLKLKEYAGTISPSDLSMIQSWLNPL